MTTSTSRGRRCGTVARIAPLAAMLIAASVVVAGCGSADDSSGGSTSRSASASAGGNSDGSSGGAKDTKDAGDTAMNMDMGGGKKPSQPASMICGDEIRDSVKRTFALSTTPSPKPDWDLSDRIFHCTYTLSGSPFRMSVQDATDEKAGRAYFDKLRTQIRSPHTIRGLPNLGFPSYENSTGDVVFLKDGKTLHVDATQVSKKALPPDFSRADAAYAVAASVIACWSE